MNKFQVIVPVYNAEEYIEKCIKSIISQDYKNFNITIIDDLSTDNTLTIARNYPVNIHQNAIHNGSGLCGMIPVIESFDPEDIIVEVDGDDLLAGDSVLSYLNQIYQEDVWLTYGQFAPLSGVYYGYCVPFGLIKKFKQFGRDEDIFVTTRDCRRKGVWITSHLRSWKQWLFARIDEKDFLDQDGNYFITCSDVAVMYPMLEMAGEEHIKYIDKVLYIYNDLNIRQDKEHLKKNQEDMTFLENKEIYASISRNI